MSEQILAPKTKRRLFIFEIVGAVFTAVMATVLHFLYEWSGRELFTALFSAVNESVWEHMKIFSLPYVVWGFVELFCIRLPFRRFAAAKVIGLYVMLITMPTFFYTYSGIIGSNIAVIDIASGYAITALAFYVSYRLTAYAPRIDRYFTAAMVLFALYCVMIAFFTFAPPDLNIFKSPGSGQRVAAHDTRT